MAQPPEPPSTQLEFQRLAEIAVGATARILLCRLTSGPRTGQLAAIKRLLPHIADDPQCVDMFRDEAWMTAALENPHVVQVLGFGADDEGPYLAVEFVRGVSLARLMKTVFETGEMFTERLVVYLGAAICDGLHAAHELRSPTGEWLALVHRDVTPGNVLLGFDGQVKIADFGLAKAKQRLTKTLTGLLKGQPYYMSPEQIGSRPLDRRSDVFAVGVLLFELFAGCRPWIVATDLEAIRATSEDPPANLLELRPRIDPLLVTIVNRCLEKDPDQRFQTALELRDCLQQWLDSHGYRDGNDVTLSRFVRRNAMRQMRWFDRAVAGHFIQGHHAPPPELAPVTLERTIATRRDIFAQKAPAPLGPLPPVPPGSQAALHELPGVAAQPAPWGAGGAVDADDGDEGPTLIDREVSAAHRALHGTELGEPPRLDGPATGPGPASAAGPAKGTHDATTQRRHAVASSQSVAVPQPLPPGATLGVVAPHDPDVPPIPPVAPGPALPAVPPAMPVPPLPPGLAVPLGPLMPSPGARAPVAPHEATVQLPGLGVDASAPAAIDAEAERYSARAREASEQARRAALAAEMAARLAGLAAHAAALARVGRHDEAVPYLMEARRLEASFDPSAPVPPGLGPQVPPLGSSLAGDRPRWALWLEWLRERWDTIIAGQRSRAVVAALVVVTLLLLVILLFQC